MTCETCGTDIVVRAVRSGRPARYCSNACRQRAFRLRAAAPAEESVLPIALDTFVGRSAETQKLRSFVRSSRLVTLVGPGGVGKTRLALDFASARGGRVLFVELESVTSRELPLSEAICVAFGIAEQGSSSDALVTMIGDGQVLLVLDNCEHLIEPCAHLVQLLLRRCPRLHVLATSREPLRIPAEKVLRIAGLPNEDSSCLFVDRASSADPDFVADDDLVREICLRVDGIPLAIELVARHVGALPLSSILSGVDDLLVAGHRTAPARHRELRATIEWSHRLLTPAEQVVFRRIAVLPGGFSLSGATALCPDVPRVQEIVCELVAKSLVERVPGEERFRQLRAIRAYGFERLSEAGEVVDAFDRAVDWLSDLVSSLWSAAFDAPAVERLAWERENLVAALTHAEGHPLLSVGLARLWFRAGRLSTCRELLSSVHGSSYAYALAARAACMQGDNDIGLRLADEAVRLDRSNVDAVDAWSFALLCRREFPEAIASYRECLTLARGSLDTLWCRQNLAWALLCAGSINEASVEISKCLGPLDDAPHGLRMAALHTLGAIRLRQGFLDAAEETFIQVLRDTPPDRHEVAYPVEALALVAARRADHARAVRLCSAALEIRRRTGVPAETDWQRQLDEAIGRSSCAVSRSRAEELAASGRRLRWDRLLAYAVRGGTVEHPLTYREMEIAALVAEGLTNRQIASRLRLSAGTVAFHLNHVRDKLGVRTRTQIALWHAGFVTSSSGGCEVRTGPAG